MKNIQKFSLKKNQVRKSVMSWILHISREYPKQWLKGQHPMLISKKASWAWPDNIYNSIAYVTHSMGITFDQISPLIHQKYRDLTACNLYMSTRKEIFLYYFEHIKGYCRAILLLVLQQNGTGKGNYLYSNEKQNMSNPHEQSFAYN